MRCPFWIIPSCALLLVPHFSWGTLNINPAPNESSGIVEKAEPLSIPLQPMVPFNSIEQATLLFFGIGLNCLARIVREKINRCRLALKRSHHRPIYPIAETGDNLLVHSILKRPN